MTANLPDYWNWKAGQGVAVRVRDKRGVESEEVRSVNDIIIGRSDLVRNGLMSVDEWLNEARRLWRRDHP